MGALHTLQTVKCRVHTASGGHGVLIFSFCFWFYVLKLAVKKRKVLRLTVEATALRLFSSGCVCVFVL